MGVAENKAVVQRLFDEMLFLTFNAAGQVVHQRGIVDNLAGLRQVGVMPTPPQARDSGDGGPDHR